VQHGDVAAHLGRPERLERLVSGETEQHVEGAAVVGKRRRREPALVLQSVEVLAG
jgi:hypothetical protein